MDRRTARKQRAGLRYGFSCLTCRRRKVRCDGMRPRCSTCTKSGELCGYGSQDASLSRLSNALEKVQARVIELEGRSSSSPTGRHVESPDDGETNDEDTTGDVESEELSTDENGNLEYYGATSRFHVGRKYDAAGDTGTESRPRPLVQVPVDEEYHRRWLRSNARFQPQWERVIQANLSRDPDLDADSASTLLRIYWTWQAPLHQCVYKRCFTRDMALGGGRYFSQFLLNVIYAHACRHAKADDLRFHQFQQGEVFLRKAKQLLIDELGQDKPRIPTIQGLLILGGRQCAIGKSSEGWLYTGMAIRMIKDLGFHLPKAQDVLMAHLEPDDLEAKKRLYLSAYAWDKSISLTLGRPPALTEMPYAPHCLLDDSDAQETWTPFYLQNSEHDSDYPLTYGHYTATFSYFVEYATIVNDIFATIYNNAARSRKVNLQQVIALEERLRRFNDTLPDSLKVEDIALKSHCPPPHIFTLNVNRSILCPTGLILLYRPFLPPQLPPAADSSSPASSSAQDLRDLARQVCTEASAKVNAFFQAYGRTFWFRNQTYLTSYCVYTAATIEVLQVRDPDPEVSGAAIERLGTTLRMLEAEALQTPGISRSMDIIRTQLRETTEAGQRQVLGSSAQHLAPVTSSLGRAPGSMPAVPGPHAIDIQAGAGGDGIDVHSRSSGTEDALAANPALWPNWLLADSNGGFMPDTLGTMYSPFGIDMSL